MLKKFGNSQYPVVENNFKVIKSLYANKSHLNEMSRFYDHVKILGSRPFEKVIDIINNQANAAIILDAGCGTGNFWNYAQNLGYIQSLFLLDQSPNLVEYACKKAKKIGINNVQGITADLNIIDIFDTISLFIDNRVDVILSLQVYHHLHQVINTHNQLRKLLCENGIIVATTCDQSHMYELYEQVALFFDINYQEARGLKHFNERHLLNLEGLIESQDIVGKIQCNSSDIFIDYILSLAILDRFDIRGKNIAVEFINYMKKWAEEKLSNTGFIEFHQSVKLAIFKA
jgi:2-polyprenyl-3-methyl-5-hydroxy-6-metoxy-1,4-benzoquinol methylase